MLQGVEIARGQFACLVTRELQIRPVALPDFVCRKPQGGRSIIEKVVDLRQPELCREHELRKLVNLLFKTRSAKRYLAHRYVDRFAKSRGVQKPPYNNRKLVRRGKPR